ncbi:NAD(P)-dependent oxidoreductase [Solirubrobacter sp. CPCC 204708]|uniref:NAD(P)-dependent oxidoreductase n=1 Tax=Solirubrobacter deserti TaxID=2282478 RepID=A0ABT4RQ83_9ACTN|nr:NAD(P)-dependent oxidoreductase [Solirubrobacter deserti]MBE2320481.1 NAD(P)-dependent oxidoreductase [Solirubrobacter deserti]MDA0140727.1 NAD(P)-dependent oxidoreductase [Solirubrobacter deserti]
MRIAVLGTGIMGAPMARNLASAGHEVRAWNRTAAKAEGLGASVAGTPREAVEGAEVVITMLADGPTVAAVMDDVTLPDGVVWWQASTIGVEWPAKFAPHVDGPVMGTRKPAEDGKLTVLASGPGRERLGEVFAPVSAKVIDLGDEIGAGQRMKLVGNAWVLGLVEALAETIALAEQLDVDPRAFLSMIEGGLMDTPYARLKGEPMIAREFPPSFPLVLAAKDAGLISDAAPDLPLPRLIRQQMLKVVEAGYGDEDLSATIRALWQEPS